MQLKGYLLLFEQFLANLTAQLGNINRFFSAEPDEQATYFYSALFELSDVQKLLMRFPAGGDWTAWAAFIANPDNPCLLYTSDAADERSSVDLGGRRIIKKKKTC